MKQTEHENLFKEGQNVVCINDSFPWIEEYGGIGPAIKHPKKDEVLVIDEILGEFLRFDKYDTEQSVNWWLATHFAPIEQIAIEQESVNHHYAFYPA